MPVIRNRTRFIVSIMLITIFCSKGWCISVENPISKPDTEIGPSETGAPVLKDPGEKYRLDHQSKNRITIIPKTIMETKNNITQFRLTITELWSAPGRAIPDLAQAMRKFAGNKNLSFLLMQFMLFAAIVSAGLAAEFFFFRFIKKLKRQGHKSMPTCLGTLFAQIFGRLIKDITGLIVFSITILCLFILFVPSPGVLHELAMLFFPAIFIVRMIYLLLTFIYSPKDPQMRMVPQDCLSSMLYFWGILAFVAITVVMKRSLFLLKAHDLSQSGFMLMFSVIGLLQFLMLAAVLFMDRTRITRVIMKKRYQADAGSHSDTGTVQALWLTTGIIILITFEILWQYNLIIHQKDLTLPLLLTLLSFPLGSLIYSMGSRLLLIASGRADLMDPRVINKDILKPEMDLFKKLNIEPPEPTIDVNGKKEQEPSLLEPYLPALDKTMALLIGLLLLFWIFRLWGIEIPLGLKIVKSASTIFVTLLFAYIFWEAVKAYIDMKIREEMPEEDVEEGDGEGGAGGSRKATILTLARKFIFTGLVIVALLTTLSALGINIGPLLAGAGILGLAIGFGSQALVKDILSGLFFLIDDAFRVGDYIETTGIKGMVQQISLRSIKVRHPRGMLFTIPYGDMGAIQNFSRDYIITKLDIRVRYDADIEKIRKIVKKIYKEILLDDELAPTLLGKIKSQGVREMDDSAMILRVKFKTIPGGQFMIRKAVFHKIQEKFRENNIEFAHKNVTVYLPQETKKNPELAKAGAAAAAAAEQAQTPAPVKG